MRLIFIHLYKYKINLAMNTSQFMELLQNVVLQKVTKLYSSLSLSLSVFTYELLTVMQELALRLRPAISVGLSISAGLLR